MRLRCLALLMPMALFGCTLAPTYERPAAPVPSTWPQGTGYTPSEQAFVPTTWEALVLDADLRSVITLALTNNRDLRKAAANIESARAQYRLQRSELWPQLNASANASRSRTQVETLGQKQTVYSKSVSASVGLSAYELDLFGRVRSLSESAQQSLLATEEASRATYISLIAETANAYLTLASDRAQLRISEETLESAGRTVNLIQGRLSAGIASRVDLRQAQTIYEQARADIANYQTLVAQDRNALELLVGQTLDDAVLPQPLEADKPLFAEVSPGLSSDVLLRRPDVLRAEHNLLAANANIGAARAAFFPQLSLTSSVGLSSNGLSSLFSSANKVWSFMPSVSIPIFTGGANTANLNYSKAQRDYYVADYEQSIQTAFREVADALARRGTLEEQLSAQAALLEAASESYQLSDARYRRGIDTFLNALDAQRTLYNAQKSLINARQIAEKNRIELYRVLGGI